MKKIIFSMLTLSVLPNSLTVVESFNHNYVYPSDSVKTSTIFETKKMAFVDNSIIKQEAQKKEILKALFDDGINLYVNIDKLDKNKFSLQEMNLLKNFNIPIIFKDLFIQSLKTKKDKYKTTIYNCGGEKKLAIVTYWYTWISGYWHLDFNHETIEFITDQLTTAGEIAAMIGESSVEFFPVISITAALFISFCFIILGCWYEK